MEKENKLVKKVKRLLKRLGCPRWLNRFGSKKYEFYQQMVALLIRVFCRLSYRRVKKLLDWLGLVCPSKSALQRTSAKLDSVFWSRVLKATSKTPYIVAIDSTCFSRTNPSYHYLRRINGALPKVPVKASLAVDTRTKKVIAAKIRVLPAHDIKDAFPLIKKAQTKKVVADKAYDSNKIYEYCHKKNITAHIPLRNYGTPRFHRWNTRQKAAKKFNQKTYHRREMAESTNSSIKRTMGSSVSSKKAKTIRTEIYGRLTCHNIFFWLSQDSGQSLLNPEQLY
jgi:hypothetical protein